MTKHTRIVLTTLSATLALTLAAGFLVAGPLNPPAGSIAPTFKTLTEVEPRIVINAANTPGDADSLFRITAPGSYYLVGNIQGVTGKSGIEIATDSVSIDLNGFAMLGTSGSLAGITAPSRTNVCVRNGTVRGWGAEGVNLYATNDCRANDLIVEFNTTHGLRAGLGARIDRVTARGNSTGISAASNSVITGSIAIGNWIGMDIGSHTLARDCVASDNTGDGYAGSGTGPAFENCAAVSNEGDGFSVSSHARVEGCVARFNKGNGISFGSYSHIVGNQSDNNGVLGTGAGLFGAAGVIRSRIEGNTCVGSDYGIWLLSPSNLVVGNRCSVNTVNFELASGNRVGMIVTLPTSGAISGNSGGNSAGSDPVCNLAY